MNDHDDAPQKVAALDISLERDVFMRTFVRELANVLSDVVGTEEASGFLSVVGQVMGRQINLQYLQALQLKALSREQVAAVLVDFKRRIKGDFYVIEQDNEKIVLGNRLCPFAEKVLGQKTLCMMTSNVFGSITADNLGYAKVQLKETIAEGRPECRVVVYLTTEGKAEKVEGREYFKSAMDDTQGD